MWILSSGSLHFAECLNGLVLNYKLDVPRSYVRMTLDVTSGLAWNTALLTALGDVSWEDLMSPVEGREHSRVEPSLAVRWRAP